jgi:hypothetical protein
MTARKKPASGLTAKGRATGAVKEAQKNAAREMYLAPASDGSHKFSCEQIAAEMRRRWPGVTTSRESVQRWADRGGWGAIFRAGIDAGAASALLETRPDACGRSMDERLEDAIARQRHDDWRMGNNLKLLAYEWIEQNGFSNAKEAIAAFTAGMAATRAERIELTGKDGGPLEVEVSDARQRLADRLRGARQERDPGGPG